MDVKKMTEQELRSYVAGVYDVCVELMRRAGCYHKWEAIGWDYHDSESALKIASAICSGDEEYTEECFVEIWNKAIMNAAGMDEDEYYENPDTPMWKRDDCRWNKESEVWEEIR